MVKMELEGNELLDFVENEHKSQETANKGPASGRAKDYFYAEEGDGARSTLKCRTCNMTVKAPSAKCEVNLML